MSSENIEYRPYIWKVEDEDFADHHIKFYKACEKDSILKFKMMLKAKMIDENVIVKVFKLFYEFRF